MITSLNKIIEHYNAQQTKNLPRVGRVFEIVQSIVDLDILFQDFILLCREESNLNVGWLHQDVKFSIN